MDYHYQAFISYNHNDRDTRIARHIQQKLEHYHLPRGLETAGGLRKIDRIFRDTGELEVSGDLNEEIEKALDNSEYLIVICSPEGRNSIWVQKEINYFLTSHPRKNVLTVLTDGEPLEVIPQILLYEENSQERHLKEPLSCDYRGSRRRADREELPRLAAVFFGCRYDELVRRKRQYVFVRVIALLCVLAAALTAVLAYYIWSSNQIRGNYKEALLNESRYLTREAAQDLEKGDAVSAIRKMQEALPGGGRSEGGSSILDSRPLYPEAQRQLTKALHLYETGRGQLGESGLEAAAMYQVPEMLQELFADAAGEYLIGCGYSCLYVWDIKTDKLVQQIRLEEAFRLCHEGLLLQDHRLIICYSHKVLCCEYPTGKICWSAAIPHAVCAARTGGKNREKLYLLTDTLLYVLDTENGEISSRKRIVLEEGEAVSDLLQAAEDDSGLVFLTRKGSDQINQESSQLDISILRAYDLKKDETWILDRTDEGRFYDIQLRNLPKKGLCVCYLKFRHQGRQALYDVACYSFEKNEQLWQQQYSYERMQAGTRINREIRLFDPSFAASHEDEVLLYRDNQLFYLKAASGKISSGLSLDGYPVQLLADPRMLIVMTEDGDVFWIDSGASRLTAEVSFSKEWKSAVKVAGQSVYYCLHPDKTLRKYALKRYDDSLTLMEGYTDSGSVQENTCSKEWTVWQTYSGFQWVQEGSGRIRSVTQNELLKKAYADLTGRSGAFEDAYLNLQMLDLDDHFLHLLVNDYSASASAEQGLGSVCSELILDLEDGSISARPVFRTDRYLDSDHVRYCRQTHTLFITGRSSGLLYAVNLNTLETKRILLKTNTENTSSQPTVFSPDGKRALQMDPDRLSVSIYDLPGGSLLGTIWLQDFSRKSIESMNSSLSFNFKSAMEDLWNGSFLALPDGEQIHLYNAGLEETDCIPYGEYRLSGEQEIPAIHFSPDGRCLYVAAGETLLRYDLKAGRITARMTLCADTGKSENKVQWLSAPEETGDQTALYLMIGETLCKVYQEEDSMGTVLEIPYVKLCNPANGCILIEQYDADPSGEGVNYSLARFYERSLEEILEIARQRIGEGEDR